MHEHAERPAGAPHGPRGSPEVADVVRLCGDAFRRAHQLSVAQARVLRDVELCRSPALGGHLDVCEACGTTRPSYNSCRNRHCPKCQALRQARWVGERERRILPTHHFHVVFTLPASLRAVALRHRRRLFDLLFTCAARTLRDLGRDRLGAELAVTAVLHTWKRDLGWHPHLHCIVSGGGLDVAADRWRSSGRKFLFPVHVMGARFRGKLLAALRAAVDDGQIELPQADHTAFSRVLYRTRWVVYAKRPFGGAEHVIRYLGRYTHRVGISNSRIETVTPDAVRFRTKTGGRVTVSPEEFLRRAAALARARPAAAGPCPRSDPRARPRSRVRRTRGSGRSGRSGGCRASAGAVLLLEDEVVAEVQGARDARGRVAFADPDARLGVLAWLARESVT